MTKSKTSGPTQPESERKAKQVLLRLRPGDIDRLDEMRGALHRSAYVARLVRVAADISPDSDAFPLLELKQVGDRWIARCVALGLEVNAATSEEAGRTLVALVKTTKAAEPLRAGG